MKTQSYILCEESFKCEIVGLLPFRDTEGKRLEYPKKQREHFIRKSTWPL